MKVIDYIWYLITKSANFKKMFGIFLILQALSMLPNFLDCFKDIETSDLIALKGILYIFSFLAALLLSGYFLSCINAVIVGPKDYMPDFWQNLPKNMMNGLKLTLIYLIYIVAIFAVCFVFFLLAKMLNNMAFSIILSLFLLIFIIICCLLPWAVNIRYAVSNNFRQAFNIPSILKFISNKENKYYGFIFAIFSSVIIILIPLFVLMLAFSPTFAQNGVINLLITDLYILVAAAFISAVEIGLVSYWFGSKNNTILHLDL